MLLHGFGLCVFAWGKRLKTFLPLPLRVWLSPTRIHGGCGQKTGTGSEAKYCQVLPAISFAVRCSWDWGSRWKSGTHRLCWGLLGMIEILFHITQQTRGHSYLWSHWNFHLPLFSFSLEMIQRKETKSSAWLKKQTHCRFQTQPLNSGSKHPKVTKSQKQIQIQTLHYYCAIVCNIFSLHSWAAGMTELHLCPAKVGGQPSCCSQTIWLADYHRQVVWIAAVQSVAG